MTSAELTAWNAGAETHARLGSPAPGDVAPVRHLHTDMTPARTAALELLGAELFWQWADRGYDAAASST